MRPVQISPQYSATTHCTGWCPTAALDALLSKLLGLGPKKGGKRNMRWERRVKWGLQPWVGASLAFPFSHIVCKALRKAEPGQVLQAELWWSPNTCSIHVERELRQGLSTSGFTQLLLEGLTSYRVWQSREPSESCRQTGPVCSFGLDFTWLGWLVS